MKRLVLLAALAAFLSAPIASAQHPYLPSHNGPPIALEQLMRQYVIAAMGVPSLGGVETIMVRDVFQPMDELDGDNWLQFAARFGFVTESCRYKKVGCINGTYFRGRAFVLAVPAADEQALGLSPCYANARFAMNGMAHEYLHALGYEHRTPEQSEEFYEIERGVKAILRSYKLVFDTEAVYNLLKYGRVC